jgi:hypothetical protein
MRWTNLEGLVRRLARYMEAENKARGKGKNKMKMKE